MEILLVYQVNIPGGLRVGNLTSHFGHLNDIQVSEQGWNLIRHLSRICLSH